MWKTELMFSDSVFFSFTQREILLETIGISVGKRWKNHRCGHLDRKTGDRERQKEEKSVAVDLPTVE